MSDNQKDSSVELKDESTVEAVEKKGSKKHKKAEKKVKEIKLDYFVDEERLYEIMVIIDPDLNESKTKAAKESLKKLITSEKGEVVFEDDTWGVRELCYKIKHKTHGLYYLLNFKIKGSRIQELEKQLLIDNQFIRHLIIKLPEDYKSEKYEDLKDRYEIKEEKKDRRGLKPKFTTTKKVVEVKEEKEEVVEDKKVAEVKEEVKNDASEKVEDKQEVVEETKVIEEEKPIEKKEKKEESKKENIGDHMDELNEKLDKLLLSDDLDDL